MNKKLIIVAVIALGAGFGVGYMLGKKKGEQSLTLNVNS
jgi:hypothetical protein